LYWLVACPIFALLMSDKDETAPLPPRPAERSWTRAEDYLDLARLWRRSARRNRKRFQPRTEPENPRFTLGALPFLLLMGMLAIMAITIIIAAIPGRQRYDAPKVEVEQGTAPPGWLDR
jgi:hypothetical protein